MSHVLIEVSSVLGIGITLKWATTKHAQTIGTLKRSHTSINQALKIETGERKSLWDKYVSIAVLNYNTSYQASIGCEASRVFQGRIPYNVLDFKIRIHPQKVQTPNSQTAQNMLEQTEMICQGVRKNAMQAYIEYKAYYDKKGNASKRKKKNIFRSYSRKQLTKEAKFPLQIFVGFDLTLLKGCYQTAYIWCAKLAPLRRKRFIG